MSARESNRRPSDTATETRRVGFRAGDGDEVESAELVALSMTASQEARDRFAADPPAGVERFLPPESATLIAAHLGAGPRQRLLLMDVTEMDRSGDHAAVRRVGKRNQPALYFVDGANVYAAAEGSKIKTRPSRDGVAVDLDRCRVVPLNLALDKRDLARRGNAPGAIELSLSLDEPVALKRHEVGEDRAHQVLEAIGRTRRPGAAGEGEVGTAGDPGLCALLLWQFHRTLQEAYALQAQWWNPFALWAAWSKFSEANYYFGLYAATC